MEPEISQDGGCTNQCSSPIDTDASLLSTWVCCIFIGLKFLAGTSSENNNLVYLYTFLVIMGATIGVYNSNTGLIWAVICWSQIWIFFLPLKTTNNSTVSDEPFGACVMYWLHFLIQPREEKILCSDTRQHVDTQTQLLRSHNHIMTQCYLVRQHLSLNAAFILILATHL